MQSFRNKSGKAQSIQTKFGIRGHVKGRQRSRNFGRMGAAKWGLGRVPRSPSFFLVIQTTFRQLRNSQFSQNLVTKVTKHISLSRRGIRKHFRKFSLLGSRSNICYFGHFNPFLIDWLIAPKIWNRKLVKQAPHSEQATGHAMHYRDILFTPRCSPRTMEFPRPSQLFIAHQHTDARYWYSNSICPSVCPWRSGIRWKRLSISS